MWDTWRVASRVLRQARDLDARLVPHRFHDRKIKRLHLNVTRYSAKRSSDTRIRREVVGQMLDDAANAVTYWPVEDIRTKFEGRCKESKLDPDQQMQEFLGDEGTPDQFWQMVKTNLQAGKVRMVFIANVIPTELRRIVEFLNEQMDPAEVLAVEIKQYVGEGMKTLVPRVMGQTAEAEKKKGSSPRSSRKWDEASFLQEFVDRNDSDHATAAKQTLDWLKQNSVQISWGSGKYGAFTATLDTDEGKQWLAYVETAGTVCVPFGWMQQRPPFDSRDKRVELLNRINEIPGVSWPESVIDDGWPKFRLTILCDPNQWQHFLDILEWIRRQIVAVYREGNMHGNPWLRLLRHEVEALVTKKSGKDHLRIKKIQKELSDLNKEARKLKTRLRAIERRRTELTNELGG